VSNRQNLHQNTAWLLIVLLGNLALIGCSERESRRDPIHRAVESLHKALRHSDVKLLEPLVTDNFVFLTAGGLGQSRAEFLRETEALLRERPGLVMDLHAELIRQGPASWNIAAERGEWVETWTQDGTPVVLKGQYQAMWRYADRGWRLAALMLVPTDCTGPYCD